jgi:hypothetical protein
MNFKKIVGCTLVLTTMVGCGGTKKVESNSVDVITTIKINGTNTDLNGTYNLNYNKKGLVTSVTSDAQNLKKATYTYDGANITKCVMQLAHSVHTHLYTYDSHNNITKDETKELSSITRTYQYTYSKKKITKMASKRGGSSYVTTYKYNSHGHVSTANMKKVVSGKEQNYDLRSYMYDANGHFNRMNRELFANETTSTKQAIRSTNTYDSGNLAKIQYGEYSLTFTYITIVPTQKKACQKQQALLLTDGSLNHSSPLNLIDMTWLISDDQ